MIDIKDVTRVYGKKDNTFVALRNINLNIPTGKSVAILGKSGSGKSTLMHVASGLDRPQSGKVLVDGVDIFKLKQKDIDKFRSNQIGFVFQSFFVQGNESVFDNVSLPLEIAGVPLGTRRKKIRSALKKVGLSDKTHNKAKDLSGGQKQRLAIARAIVNKPAILFADEPTGNLDSVTSDSIERLLFGLNKVQGTTLIIVTHDPELAKKCDMVVRIKDGQVERVDRR